MLQHNIAHAGRRAHVAHAAMMSMHALCCGLPVLAVALTALSGATSLALFSSSVAQLHAVLHGHELWILAVSAGLVLTGGVLEVSARRQGLSRGFPWMFAVSVACFAMNVAIIAIHRGI